MNKESLSDRIIPFAYRRKGDAIPKEDVKELWGEDMTKGKNPESLQTLIDNLAGEKLIGGSGKDTKKNFKMNELKPNVLIGGFPRTGTEFLHKLLKQHPDVDVGRIKEINYLINQFFFRFKNLRNYKSKFPLEWYLNNYEPKKIRIDFTIRCAYDKTCIERIKEVLGEPKIIFLVRNQKRHNFSFYKLLKSNGEIPNISYRNYKRFYKGCEDFSNFKEHISRFKDNFKNVLVVNLIDDPKRAIQKISKFLNLKKFNFNFNLNKNENYKLKDSDNLKYIKRILFVFFPFVWDKISRNKSRNCNTRCYVLFKGGKLK